MADEQRAVPPYLPYKTLISSLENLAQGIPPRIDRSIWKNQPGTVQSQILSAYRFLGLMNDTTNPTEALKELVQHRQAPAAVLKPIIEEKYKAIFSHDLSTMTTTMISSEFEKEFGVDGETKKKAVRFFLQAAKANGFTLSKFLLDQTRASNGPRKRRTKRDAEGVNGEAEFEEETETATLGTQKVISLRSGGQLTMSLSVDLFALSLEDRTFVFSIIDTLQEYERVYAEMRAK